MLGAVMGIRLTLAAAVATLIAVCGCDPIETGGEAGCLLTGHALGSVVEQAREGSTATQILGQLSELAAEAECKKLVETLVEHPQDDVTYTVQDAAEQTKTTRRGETLLDAPPEHKISHKELKRLVDCFKWEHQPSSGKVGEILTDLCLDGDINPPA